MHTPRLIFTIVCLGAATANGDLIEFVHKGRGSGTLAGVSFPDSAFTITAFGDTASRYISNNSFIINHSEASIQIVGLGLIRFQVPTATYVGMSLHRIGFKRATAGNLYDGPTDPAFDGWDMLTSIGPVYGVGQLLQWSSSYGTINTDRGILYFDSGISESTFVATVIPAPASFTVLVLPGVHALLRRRRRPPTRAGRADTPTFKPSPDAVNEPGH